MVKRFHNEGKQISIHVHGEREIDQALKAYKQVMKPHLGFVTEEQLKECGELAIFLRTSALLLWPHI